MAEDGDGWLCSAMTSMAVRPVLHSDSDTVVVGDCSHYSFRGPVGCGMQPYSRDTGTKGLQGPLSASEGLCEVTPWISSSQLGLVAHAWNSSAREAEALGLLQVPGCSG